jgi:hypothetical protein
MKHTVNRCWFSTFFSRDLKLFSFQNPKILKTVNFGDNRDVKRKVLQRGPLEKGPGLQRHISRSKNSIFLRFAISLL